MSGNPIATFVSAVGLAVTLSMMLVAERCGFFVTLSPWALAKPFLGACFPHRDA